VVYFDRERLENAQESLVREYQGLYRKAHREKEVPAPERILLDIRAVIASSPRRVSFQTIKGNGEEGALRILLNCDPPRSFFGNITYLKEELTNLTAQQWEL